MEKNKGIDKSSIALLGVFIVLCAMAIIGFLNINRMDSNKTKSEENKGENLKQELSYHEFQVCTYGEFYESDGYVFFDDTVVYECQSPGEFGCYIPRIDEFEYCNKTDSVALLTDNQKDFLYNYKTQNVILEADSFNKIIYNELGDVAYLIFSKDGKEGIASLNGDILVEATYDSISIAYPGFSGEYSLKSGVVVAFNEDKYGVLEIETGKVVVPFEYNSIKVYDGYYVLNKDGEIYLVDSKLNRILDEEFEDIVIFNDTIIAQKDKQLSFYNLSGSKIVDDTIKINRSFSHFDNTGYSAYSMDQYNQVLTIEVYGDNTFDYEACYELHLVDKKLNTLDCNELVDIDE